MDLKIACCEAGSATDMLGYLDDLQADIAGVRCSNSAASSTVRISLRSLLSLSASMITSSKASPMFDVVRDRLS